MPSTTHYRTTTYLCLKNPACQPFRWFLLLFESVKSTTRVVVLEAGSLNVKRVENYAFVVKNCKSFKTEYSLAVVMIISMMTKRGFRRTSDKVLIRLTCHSPQTINIYFTGALRAACASAKARNGKDSRFLGHSLE
jgi:hypothetical protein